ncbi:MAG: DeoR family transcriptional regulator [Desulfobacteraceae bacterium]|nr:DeoR family transcriptional regulator [Desulfobacteraceae bacterium]MBU4053201.1 DeoR family transcriptional regulator [Pseudomonadota bacterium]
MSSEIVKNTPSTETLVADIFSTAEGIGKSTPVKQRHEGILQVVKEEGFVTIETLANRFDVTPQTIRRDINTLSEEGRLLRYHGGAAQASSTENVSYPERQVMCLKEKQQIARMLVEQIPDYASLFINIGTTTEAVARALCRHRGLKVITNNLNVANILKQAQGCEIIITGGLVRPRDGGVIGEATIDFIRQFKVDYGIIGISGIDMDGTLLDFDYREVRVARAIIDNSRNVFLAADHTKFGRSAMVRLANISEIEALFTDRKPPGPLAETLAGAETRLYVAEPDSSSEFSKSKK